MKFTLQELATKTHCSLRLIESNLSDKKEELLKESLIEFDGKKWLVYRGAIKSLTRRKYTKHYVNYDNRIKIDSIDLTSLVKEKEYRTFITVAPKGIKSLQKMKDVVRDLFELYHTNYSTDIPTYFVYGIEDNTDYLNEKQNRGYHIHIVTTAEFNPEQRSEIYELLVEQLGEKSVHKEHTVQVSPYVLGVGIGALNYTIKSNHSTGCYIK